MNKVLVFAVSVFLLSCADDTRDNPYDERAVNYIGKSSAEGSSSSVETSSSSAVPLGTVLCEFSGICSPVSLEVCVLAGGTPVQSCPESSSSRSSSIPPSSSSAAPSSSSAPPSSSSVAPSSSRPSSSSVSTPSSSTGGGGGGGKADCGDLSPGDVNFKCEWSRALVVSGKKTTPTINILSGDGNCTSNISYLYTAGFGSCEVAFNNGTEYSTGAEDRLKTIGCQGDLEYFSWPVPTDSKDERLDVKASVTCGSSCKQVDCPLTITSSPKPDVTGDINCDWPLLSGNGTNKYLSIGAELPNCTGNVTVKNPGEDEANCGDVTYENSGSTSSAGKVYGRAVATCSGSKKTLKEYEATVVEDPTLGACTWKDNKVVLAKGQEATPSSEVSNSYGRCGKVTFSDGYPKVLTESDVGTVKVKASADCGDKGTIEKSCPDLEVKSAIYELKKENDKITIPNESTVIEMDLPSGWKTTGSDATFFCQVDRGSSGTGSVSGKIGTGTSAVTMSGSDYATAKIPLNWTTGKYSLQVDIKCSNSCSCGVGL